MHEKYIKFLLRLLKEHHIMELYFSNITENKIKNFNELSGFLNDINPYLYISGTFGWKNDYNWSSLNVEYTIHSHANTKDDDELKEIFWQRLPKFGISSIFDERILGLLYNYINKH